MTTVFQKSNEAIQDLINVLTQLAESGRYAMSSEALSDATIGQHTRHIIELYQCLLAGYSIGEVNYDDRKRNVLYETNVAAAVSELKRIQAELLMPDKQLKIFLGSEKDPVCIESNYYREILYNLEHCIHHQALIKVGLVFFKDINISEGFGIASSTLHYRNQCAQ